MNTITMSTTNHTSASDAGPLQLLHLLPDPHGLTAWAARHHLLDASGDLGYALHSLLHAAFGEQVPQPFRYLGAEQGLLAYTTLPSARLLQLAALAPADVAAALGLGATASHAGLSVRPFPSEWPMGHVLGFELRARPVIREGKTGRERDAFLAAIEGDRETAATRESVYTRWLSEHLQRQGGAELLDSRMTQFQLLDVSRRTQRLSGDQPRQRRSVGGPDALLTGHLRVTNAAAFAELLQRGVGRHRAFGFGLLLLRPAQR